MTAADRYLASFPPGEVVEFPVAGLDVLDYTDDAEGVMPQGERPMRITRITLRPRVLVAAGSDVIRFDALVHEAHEACFIASSLTSEVVVEATVEVAPKENPS